MELESGDFSEEKIGINNSGINQGAIKGSNEDELIQRAKDVALEFKKLDESKTIRIISHLDADGISAASILIKTLNRCSRKYSISIVQQLTEEKIQALSKERYKVFMFTDIGSGQIDFINKYLSDRKVFILDHHELQSPIENKSIIQLNPHLFGIDGNDQISGSGVVYLFSKEVNITNKDMAHIAIIGAIGDIQEQNGFSKLNGMIVDDAKSSGKLKVINGIRIFGAQTKPLYKLLQYSTDPYIPGVSGSEMGAINFLNRIGIKPRNSEGFVKLVNLSDEEIKKLTAGIIMQRISAGIKDAQSIIGPVYILKEEKKESPLRDAREFATLLNACGRLGEASVGIGTCLGDPKIKRKALDTLTTYKREIMNSLRWYDENKSNKRHIIKESKFLIINAEDKVKTSIIGTMSSILSKSDSTGDMKYIIGLARNEEELTTKVSIRCLDEEADAREMMHQICNDIYHECGGHKSAAGAVIKSDEEEKFIENAKKFLKRVCIEERVK